MVGRARRVDISDLGAATLLGDHIRLEDTTSAAKSIFKYSARNMKSGPSWVDMKKQRHFLYDLVKLTDGHLLRQRRWERQVGDYFRKHNIGATRDEISMIAYRPRMMLSHLQRLRNNDGRGVPRTYEASVAGLATMMRASRQANHDEHNDDDDNNNDNDHNNGHSDDSDDSDDVTMEPIAKPPIETLCISSDEGSDADSDLDRLEKLLFNPVSNAEALG